MPWESLRVVEEGVEYIDSYDIDFPNDKFRVYKFVPDRQIIEYYPKARDGFSIKKVTLEGFTNIPEEFAEAGYIKGKMGYYLSKKLIEKNVFSLTISKKQKDSVRKVRNKEAYRMVLNYLSFQKMVRSLTNIESVAKKDRRFSVDSHFNHIFPECYSSIAVPGQNYAARLISSLDNDVIRYLKPDQIKRILEFMEFLLQTKYTSVSYRQKLVGAAKIKVDEVALQDVINTFEKMLSESLSEAKWGDFLQKNLFLIESKYIKLLSQLNVVLATSRLVDFGLLDSQGYLDLFEIKKPNTPILAKNKDRGNYYWNAEATKAIVQAEKYLYNSERKATNLTEDINRELGISVKIVRPRSVVIMGNSNQFDSNEKRDDFRILRMSLRNVEVILYDELLERLKNQQKKIYIESTDKKEE
jgi:hypothetical protein